VLLDLSLIHVVTLLQVAITLVDKGGGKINITWGSEYCQITVPPHGLPPSQLPGPANLSFIPLTTTGYMLFGGTILFVTILGTTFVEMF
jgi:hypothetical protein